MLIVAYSPVARCLERAPFPLHLEPKLVEMDRLLDDPKLLLQVTNDLAESAPQALCNGLCWLFIRSELGNSRFDRI